MIHSEENNGFDIKETLNEIKIGFLLLLCGFIIGVIANNNKSHPTTKPPLTELNDKCPANTFEPIKLTGSFNSIKTDSVKTDKLNFPMWCPLIEDKPRGWGLKK